MTWKISNHRLNIKDLVNEESLYFIGNGYLGIRGNFEEGACPGASTIRGTYINAFHDVVDIAYGEKLYAFPNSQQKLVNIIDSQSIDIFLGEERFSLCEGEILQYARSLHFDKGFSERSVHWRSPLGKEVQLTFRRLVSFVEKEVFLQQVILTPVNFTGKVKMVSTINGDVSNYTDDNDPRVSSSEGKHLRVTHCDHHGDWDYVEAKTLRTRLKVACGASVTLNTSHSRNDYRSEHQVVTELAFDLTQETVFEKKNLYVDSLRHGHQLFKKVSELMNHLRSLHFQQFAAWQKHYLDDFWSRADVEISGDDSLQEAIRFNLYHLLQSVGRDTFSNISAKGLSGEGYEGHYFWDTEIYMFPVFLMTNPELAKNLLIYRYSILDDARARAKEMGHAKGALFPWRTISGSECSSYFPAGTAQYHISADIAYSFIQYYISTYDHEFLYSCGAEVLFETARLWMETGHFLNGEFRIDGVTGPDEYTCIVNNNYYTNVMAKHNLRWAERVYRQLRDDAPEKLSTLCKKINLGGDEPEGWNKACQSMYLPYDSELGINPQDDTFLQKEKWDLAGTPKEKFPLLLHCHPLTLYRYQVCKQADTVLAHFLLEDEQSNDTIKKSFDYYEQVTTHDSSLSYCVFSVMAARIGYYKKAYEYFIETARLDLDNKHGNTKDGLHMANMGGTWLAIIFGFAGVRIKETGLSFYPHIPGKWKSYSFHIQFQNRLIKVCMTNDELMIQLVKGDPLNIKVYNQTYLLDSTDPITIKSMTTC